MEVAYASIPQLLEMKAGTGRPKDEIDTMLLTEIATGRRAAHPVDLAAMEPDPTAGQADADQDEWPRK